MKVIQLLAPIVQKASETQEKGYALLAMTNTYYTAANFPKSLQLSFQGLSLSERWKDDALIARFLNMAFITLNARSYNNRDYRAALAYGLRGFRIAYRLNDRPLIARLSYNVAGVYQNMGKPFLDSARYYMQLSYETLLADHNADIGYALNGLGNLEDSLHHTSAALKIYHKALQHFSITHNYRLLAIVNRRIAALYRDQQPDSALTYALRSYKLAEQHHILAALSNTGSLLSELYAPTNELQSLRYYKIAAIAHDSINNAERTKQFQMVTIQEKLREAEQAEEQRRAAEERRETLQLFAIALFIPVFIMMVFRLSKTRLHRRIIDFMGVLSLLLAFEFITLLIHPYIERLTNHTPVLELIVLVILASILVPAHHQLTHWLKERLANPIHKKTAGPAED